MKKIISSISLMLFAFVAFAQTQNDTLFNYKSEGSVTVDAIANEACWEKAAWNKIDQVWIPFAADVSADDFQGKFKVSWDEQYLYLLVEIVDDSLSDDYSNPLQNWWDDDCLEIFIDENRSKGNHEFSNNAFAYHISLKYDAIDLSPSGNGINYKEHVNVVMDTIGDHTYLWEMAIKIYNDTYNNNSKPENSRVQLQGNKAMGLAVAYCDSDADKNRENFFGSMVMTSATNNDMYKNADYFGYMELIDPNFTDIFDFSKSKDDGKVYPNPVKDKLIFEFNGVQNCSKEVFVYNSIGQVVHHMVTNDLKVEIDVADFEPGIYFISTQRNGKTISNSFIK